MDRKFEFEIEYLLSLIAALLGSLAIDSISNYIDTSVAKILLILVAIHIVLFNIVYSLRRATTFETFVTDQLEEYSKYTLWLITAAFLFFLFHSIGGWIFIWKISETDVYLNNPQVRSVIRNIITFVVPILVTVGVGYAGWRYVHPALEASKNVDVDVYPKEVKINSLFEDTQPLAITITNRSDQDFEFEVTISLPDNVVWRDAGTEASHSGDLKKEFVVEAEGMEPIDLQFQYDGGYQKSAKAEVEVSYKYGTYTNEIRLFLDPNSQ